MIELINEHFSFFLNKLWHRHNAIFQTMTHYLYFSVFIHLQIANGEDEISTLNPQQGPFTFLPVTLTRNIHFLLAKQHKTAKQIVIPYVRNNFPDEYRFTNI